MPAADKSARKAKIPTAPTYFKKSDVEGEFIHIDAIDWQVMPEPFCINGIRYKLLHVSPELGAWTAIYDCPAGSYFNAHIHLGPGEYFLTKGRMEVRGGSVKGGATAYALGYGYEPANARHDKTYFPIASEFYMTFIGPLHFLDDTDKTIAVVGWKEVQTMWLQQTGGG